VTFVVYTFVEIQANRSVSSVIWRPYEVEFSDVCSRVHIDPEVPSTFVDIA